MAEEDDPRLEDGEMDVEASASKNSIRSKSEGS